MPPPPAAWGDDVASYAHRGCPVRGLRRLDRRLRFWCPAGPEPARRSDPPRSLAGDRCREPGSREPASFEWLAPGLGPLLEAEAGRGASRSTDAPAPPSWSRAPDPVAVPSTWRDPPRAGGLAAGLHRRQSRPAAGQDVGAGARPGRHRPLRRQDRSGTSSGAPSTACPSRVTATSSSSDSGNLVSFGASRWTTVDVDTNPTLDATLAIENMMVFMGSRIGRRPS